jgi:hypothetical protein
VQRTAAFVLRARDTHPFHSTGSNGNYRGSQVKWWSGRCRGVERRDVHKIGGEDGYVQELECDALRCCAEMMEW